MDGGNSNTSFEVLKARYEAQLATGWPVDVLLSQIADAAFGEKNLDGLKYVVGEGHRFTRKNWYNAVSCRFEAGFIRLILYMFKVQEPPPDLLEKAVKLKWTCDYEDSRAMVELLLGLGAKGSPQTLAYALSTWADDFLPRDVENLVGDGCDWQQHGRDLLKVAFKCSLGVLRKMIELGAPVHDHLLLDAIEYGWRGPIGDSAKIMEELMKKVRYVHEDLGVSVSDDCFSLAYKMGCMPLAKYLVEKRRLELFP